MIPIIAIVVGCAIPMLAIYTDYRKRREMFALFHQERMAAIEKGIELPPMPAEFLNSFLSDDDNQGRKPRSSHRQLLVGLVWLFLGLACFVSAFVVEDASIAKFTKYGVFPVGIGLAYLIYYFTVGRKESEALEAERTAKLAETNRPSAV